MKADSDQLYSPPSPEWDDFPGNGVGNSSAHKTREDNVSCVRTNAQTSPFLSQSHQLLCFSIFSPSCRAALSLHSSASATMWIFSRIFGFLSVDAERQLGPISSGETLTWERLQVSYVCCDSSFLSSLLQENQLKKNSAGEASGNGNCSCQLRSQCLPDPLMGKAAQKGFAHKNKSLLVVRAGQEAFVLNPLQAVCISIPSFYSSLPRSPGQPLCRPHWATCCGCCCKCVILHWSRLQSQHYLPVLNIAV